MQTESVVRATMRALAAPRRLVPILLVCVPLVMLQARWNARERLAAPLGIAMCVSFVLAAPLSWRVLFPDLPGATGRDLPTLPRVLRLATYGAIGGAVILVVGWAMPRIFEMRPTLLTLHSSLAVCLTLFLVGGWGLGRDIALEARVALLAREAEHAQLLALRSHLDPHFLFNTLNAIAEWCREDGEVAERAVLELSGILRAVLAGVKSPAWPLADEMKLVRSLYALHLLRDPSLFELDWQVADDALSVPVPPMIVLPVAENSVKHGPGAGRRGPLRVSAFLVDGSLVVRVENPGAWGGPRDGSDGLPTVERRLALAYDGAARLTVESDADRSAVSLSLPASGPRTGIVA